MSLFDPFMIKTQENNEIMVSNSVMASQAIIQSAQRIRRCLDSNGEVSWQVRKCMVGGRARRAMLVL